MEWTHTAVFAYGVYAFVRYHNAAQHGTAIGENKVNEVNTFDILVKFLVLGKRARIDIDAVETI